MSDWKSAGPDGVAAGIRSSSLDVSAAAQRIVEGILQRAQEAAFAWDVPDSGLMFLPGDKVTISGTSVADGVYEVTKGDDPDTVWVNPNSARQFEMKRIDPDA